MISFLIKIIKMILKIILIIVAGLFLLQFIASKGANQEKFAHGTIPKKLPDGFYAGKVAVGKDIEVSWLGKFFSAKEQTGYNIFNPLGGKMIKYLTPLYKGATQTKENNTTAYHFKTSISKGVHDPNLEVIKIDYSKSDNPFIIRPILDEIVETGPNEYLGKVHLHIYKDTYITLGYFKLKQ